MHDVAIGIDIGTSYTKGVALDENGSVISIQRKQTVILNDHFEPHLVIAINFWHDVKEIFSQLLCNKELIKYRVVSICVSAIAPTLTVFDSDRPDNAYSILYSTVFDPLSDELLGQCDPFLTEKRLEYLKSISSKKKFKKPCITDLVGYINFRLTNELTVNSISLSWMGLSGHKDFQKKLCVNGKLAPRPVAVLEKIGLTSKFFENDISLESGIPVCGGCPDAMGSVVGSGMKYSSDTMIYLGTFGSVLKLDYDVDLLLKLKEFDKQPFNWILSVPGFGPQIEILSKQWFGHGSAHNCLLELDETAKVISPGANGMFFSLPRWKNGMIPVGEFAFVQNNLRKSSDVRDKSRALLESIGFAIRVLDLKAFNTIYVSGGGAKSKIWLDIISIVLQNAVKAFDLSWEAIGTAEIAGRMIWSNGVVFRSSYISNVEFTSSRDLINDNYFKIKKYYYEHKWL